MPQPLRPRQFSDAELKKVGVAITDPKKPLLQCDSCGAAWTPDIGESGQLPRGYWRCPNSCNADLRPVTIHRFLTLAEEGRATRNLIVIQKTRKENQVRLYYSARQGKWRAEALSPVREKCAIIGYEALAVGGSRDAVFAAKDFISLSKSY